MDNEKLTFNDYVRLSLDSGVAPIELRFYPFEDCESGFPVAYRTSLIINSVIAGTLTEKDFSPYCDNHPCGVQLFRHHLQHAITAILSFAKAEKQIEFISVACPADIVNAEPLFDLMSDVLKKNPRLEPQKLCLEFSPAFLADTEKARAVVMDMKVLKVRTMLTGCGTEDFPLSKLLRVPADIAMLHPSVTEWAGSRDKPKLVPSLINYVNSMGAEVVAEGEEEKRPSLRNTECIGFLPVGAQPLTWREVVEQKAEEDL